METTIVEIPSIIEDDVSAMAMFINDKLHGYNKLASFTSRLFLRYSEYMLTLIHQGKSYAKEKTKYIKKWADFLYQSATEDWKAVLEAVELPDDGGGNRIANYIEFMLPSDVLLDKWHDVIGDVGVVYDTLSIEPNNRIIALIKY